MMRQIFYLIIMVFITTYTYSQCYVKEYPSNRRILRVDGDYVLDYTSNKRIYKFDNDYLVSYSGSKRLLKFDGDYIIRYSDYKRIAWGGLD